MDWVLAHQSSLASYALIGTFALVALAECLAPLRPAGTSLVSRWISNISLAVIAGVAIRFCLPFVAVGAALFAQEHRWGVLHAITLPAWASVVLGVLLLDAANYTMHRVMHAVPMLWHVHQIHHSDLDLDCGSAVRHHPLESLLTHAFTLLCVLALGIDAAAVVISEVLQLSAALFNHANIAVPRRAQRLLQSAVVTPQMHRVHHSMVYEESNRNFGNLLPWWDRAFGTYCAGPGRGHVGIQFGIARAPAPEDVTLWKLLLLPFRGTVEAATMTPNPVVVRPGGVQ